MKHLFDTQNNRQYIIFMCERREINVANPLRHGVLTKGSVWNVVQGGVATQTDSVAELRRHRLQLREVLAGGICGAEQQRIGTYIERELQNSVKWTCQVCMQEENPTRSSKEQLCESHNSQVPGRHLHAYQSESTCDREPIEVSHLHRGAKRALE